MISNRNHHNHHRVPTDDNDNDTTTESVVMFQYRAETVGIEPDDDGGFISNLEDVMLEMTAQNLFLCENDHNSSRYLVQNNDPDTTSSSTSGGSGGSSGGSAVRTISSFPRDMVSRGTWYVCMYVMMMMIVWMDESVVFFVLIMNE